MKRFIVRYRLVLFPLWVALFALIVFLTDQDAFRAAWEFIKQIGPPLFVFSLFVGGAVFMLDWEPDKTEEKSK